MFLPPAQPAVLNRLSLLGSYRPSTLQLPSCYTLAREGGELFIVIKTHLSFIIVVCARARVILLNYIKIITEIIEIMNSQVYAIRS